MTFFPFTNSVDFYSLRGKKSFYSIVVRSSGFFVACGFHSVIYLFFFFFFSLSTRSN